MQRPYLKMAEVDADFDDVHQLQRYLSRSSPYVRREILVSQSYDQISHSFDQPWIVLGRSQELLCRMGR